jgi:uncharacterized hydrophobic protein (TIGR00271 family)
MSELRPPIQDRVATLFGCEPEARSDVIAGMVHRAPRDATSYWLQLSVAAGIATLGLVLGSTAVVIGAMLIAPLMGPIVQLGMGLAVGSPFMVARVFARVVASIIVAVGGSALLTRLLPFHELTPEIAARTTPTVLDLLTAAFCAVAGVYATMRPSSDVASTAAGTSIGISLVPPLCASGFGLGSGNWSVASGAALLFTANFVAIVVIGTLAFALSGFHRVDVGALVHEELDRGGVPRWTQAIGRRFDRPRAARSAPWLRLIMPLVLLVGVYIPLRQALDQVVWQIRARDRVDAAVARLTGRVVQSRIRVERRAVEVTLVLIGSAEDAVAARVQLEDELRPAAAGLRVEVVAVPDASAIAGLELALHAPQPLPVVETAVPDPSTDIEDARALVRAALSDRWPTSTGGELLSVSMSTLGEQLELGVFHTGPPLDDPAREVLTGALEGDLGRPLRLSTTNVPQEELTLADDELEFVATLVAWGERSRALSSLWLCITEAPQPTAKRGAKPDATLRAVVSRLRTGHPRVGIAHGERWTARMIEDACPAASDVP